jgi:glutaredoxin
MSRITSRNRNLRLAPLLAFCLALCVISPAAADWLVTLDGGLIETQGPWTIAGKTVTYKDLDGKEHSLPFAEIDLEGSLATTAYKQGRPYTPPPKAVVAAATREEDEPKIILYQTSTCGYCRKARKLLDELGAEYVAKDVEKDEAAQLEYSAKGEGYKGHPLIDFDGEIVKGYNEHYIRKLVKKLQEKAASASG